MICNVPGADDGLTKLYDASLAECRAELEGYYGEGGPWFSPDSRFTVTWQAGPVYTTRVWEVGAWKLVLSLRGLAYSFDSGSRWIAMAPEGGGVQIIEVLTGQVMAVLEGTGLYGGEMPPSFEATGDRIATETPLGTALWKASTGRLLASYEGIGARFSPDGTLMLTATEADSLLWHVTKAKLLARRQGFCRFSPAGRLVLACDERTTTVWDISSGREVAELSDSDDAEFSPDGAALVTRNSAANTFAVWVPAV